MTHLHSGAAAVQALEASNAYLLGHLHQSTLVDPSHPIPDRKRFTHDVFLCDSDNLGWPVGVSRSALVQHRALLQDASPTLLDPAVILIDQADYAAGGPTIFAAFLEDPVKAVEGSGRCMEGGRKICSLVYWPKSIGSALRLCDKYDAPLIGLHIRQYFRALDYGVDVTSTSLAMGYLGNDVYFNQSSIHHWPPSTLPFCPRLEAFVLAAQVDDPVYCARMLEANGGCRAAFWSSVGSSTVPATGPWLRPASVLSMNDVGVKDRYRSAVGINGASVFDVTAWPDSLLDAVPQKYTRALMRAMRIVGVEHTVSIGGQCSPTLNIRGDWTWKEVAHEFRGLMGLHDEPVRYHFASFDGSRVVQF